MRSKKILDKFYEYACTCGLKHGLSDYEYNAFIFRGLTTEEAAELKELIDYPEVHHEQA